MTRVIPSTGASSTALVNARDAKNVPGRKTDVNDAMGVEWIHATGDARSPRRAETLVPVVGGRLSVELAATDRLAFAAYAELLAPLQRPRIEIDGATVQPFPVVAGDVGLSALERF